MNWLKCRGSDSGRACQAVGWPQTMAALMLFMAAERSFVAIKPDGVQRGLVGEILGRFERKGFKLVGLITRRALAGGTTASTRSVLSSWSG